MDGWISSHPTAHCRINAPLTRTHEHTRKRRRVIIQQVLGVTPVESRVNMSDEHCLFCFHVLYAYLNSHEALPSYRPCHNINNDADHEWYDTIRCNTISKVSC